MEETLLESQASEKKQAELIWDRYVPKPKGEVSETNHHTIDTMSVKRFLKNYEGATHLEVIQKVGVRTFAVVKNEFGETLRGLFVTFSKPLIESGNVTEFEIQERVGMDNEGKISNYFLATKVAKPTEVIKTRVS